MRNQRLHLPSGLPSALATLALLSLAPASALAQGTTVLECTAIGIGGDNAAFRGVRFEVDQTFTAVELHIQGASAGTFTFDLELRRSMGYIDPIEASVPVVANLTGSAGVTPYPGVRVDFPAPIVVTASEMFTLKVTNLSGGTMFWEVAGIGNIPCPLAVVTNENSVASPIVRTSACGLKVIDAGGSAIGTNYCTANPNSTGVAGEIAASGSTSIVANDVTLTASNLPVGQFGIFVTSKTQDFVPNVGSGNLCVGGVIGRYQQPGQIQQIDANGEFSLQIDTTLMPQGAGLVPIAPGESWNFQAWHRDFTTTPPITNTSNLTNAVEITFS